jgi:hypothetical protein
MQKDLLMDSPSEQNSADITELENLIVPLDHNAPKDAVTAARKRITEFERLNVADTEFSAALAAWSGRLMLFESRTADSREALRFSQNRSPGNTASRVLAVRLETNAENKLALLDRELGIDPAGVLHIERARLLLDMRRYREAAAAFDTAFASGLNSVYRETYKEDRDRAWELRDADSGTGTKTAAILAKPSVSWQDLIELTTGETDLLTFISAGRSWPANDMFRRLLDRSFIPLTQNVTVIQWPQGLPRIGETVTRAGAAWYIWHLYAENHADRGLLSKYSSRYSGRQNAQSPISDLPLLSPYFDSVLGVVETELLSLPDGRNFSPSALVKGAELLTILKKIK